MDYAAFTEDLKKALQPILDEEAIELVELTAVRTRKNLLLRLLVDRMDCRISLGDCTKLNNKLREYLDTTNIAGPDYILEVSSPGVDRPLRIKKDFSRCLNKKVKFFLNEAINGKIELTGIIANVGEDNLGIDVSGRLMQVPLANISRAKQVIE